MHQNPIRFINRAITIKIHKCNIWVTPIDKTKYYRLEQLLSNLPPWKPVDIEEYLPNDSVQRMRYIQDLPHAFSFKIGEYRFSSGNNAFNAISIWKVDEHVNEDLIIQENTRIVMELQANAPHYYTRAMRINYLRTCDLLLPKAKPSAL
ncbi:uncharacterized protein OCT59_014982 [Rhizophagus irregularis]|uniref:uncharacterized protein n=1 Tax=Rhizophagus irregularis TaxID=588596 RepID=UPI003334602D|nr:hypothetical protein OCT59_014982 [Rhizophagus irregularis]